MFIAVCSLQILRPFSPKPYCTALQACTKEVFILNMFWWMTAANPNQKLDWKGKAFCTKFQLKCSCWLGLGSRKGNTPRMNGEKCRKSREYAGFCSICLCLDCVCHLCVVKPPGIYILSISWAWIRGVPSLRWGLTFWAFDCQNEKLRWHKLALLQMPSLGKFVYIYIHIRYKLLLLG